MHIGFSNENLGIDMIGVSKDPNPYLPYITSDIERLDPQKNLIFYLPPKNLSNDRLNAIESFWGLCNSPEAFIGRPKPFIGGMQSFCHVAVTKGISTSVYSVTLDMEVAIEAQGFANWANGKTVSEINTGNYVKSRRVPYRFIKKYERFMKGFNAVYAPYYYASSLFTGKYLLNAK